MGSSLPSWVVAVLSRPRIDGYLAASAGNVDAAVALYRWNVEVSAAFAVPLHWAEMGFRNALHSRLAALFGRDDWWEPAPLDANGHRKVAEARAVLRRLGKDPAVSDSVVGFWVSLLASRYHRTFWMPALWRGFPGRSRQDVHADYLHLLQLRNRISHGEPIHRRHLEADHITVCRLLGELSPAALREVVRHDPVPAVLARRGAR
jgi:hypothetical protein